MNESKIKTTKRVLLDFAPGLVVWCPGTSPEHPSMNRGVVISNYGGTEIRVHFRDIDSTPRYSRVEGHCLVFRQASSCAQFVLNRAAERRTQLADRIETFRIHAVEQGWLN